MTDEINLTGTPARLEALTTREWLTLYWGLTWRGVLTTLASVAVAVLFGLLTGGVAGLVIALSGGTVDRFRLPLQLFGGAIGLVVGFGFFTVWFKWILRAHFGSLRLVLLRGHEPRPVDAPPAV